MSFVPKTLLAGLSLALMAAVTLPSAVSAQSNDGLNLTTSPVYSSLNATPGQTVETDLRVQNSSSRAVKLNVSLKKFVARGPNGEAAVVEPDKNDASLSWVKFSQTTIDAQPGVFNTVKMTIQVPESAAFGYYYAVAFSPVGANVANVRGGTLQGSSAILVLLDVQTPESKRKLGLASFQATHRVFEYLPAAFDVTVRNEGNTYAAPQGDVYISRDRKDTLTQLTFNSGQGNVLPDTSRTFRAEWTDGFPAYKEQRINGQVVSDSEGKPVRKLSWSTSDLRKVRFGRYYAHLVMVYNDGRRDVPVESVVAFWVIPWRFLLVVLLVVALILIGPIMGLRKLIKRRRPTDKKPVAAKRKLKVSSKSNDA